MRKRSVSTLTVAALALALGACGPRSQATGDPGAGQAQIVADVADASPALALQAQLEADLLGKTTPPDPAGYTDVYGHLDGELIGIGENWILHGRWTHAGEQHWVALVQRTTGTQPANERGQRPGQIISAMVVPTPRAGETLFTEYCSHPDLAESAGPVYAIAGTAQARPGLSDPPSAAWRFDRATARLLPIDDPARVNCAFEHMEVYRGP